MSAYPLALLGISGNSLLAVGALAALVGPMAYPPLAALKKSPFQPLAVAVAFHWLLYFGPMNFGAVLLNSQVQANYSWVVRKPLMAQASLVSLLAYPVVLLLLAGLAWWLRDSRLARDWQGLPPVSLRQIVGVAALMALMAVFIAPYIGTKAADAGRFFRVVPLPLRPFINGLMPLEAVPLLAASLRAFSLPRPTPPIELPRFLGVAALQILTFILLRQRFLALIAVVLVGLVLSLWLRRRQLLVGIPVGLLLAYAIPTALRYGRYPPRPGQPLSEYLAISTRNFIGGLLPGQMINAALNDFSYNKAGMASLSVLLDMRQANLLQSQNLLGWLRPEIFRAFPGALKERLPDWGSQGAETLVSRAIGVGQPGWTNWGLPEVVPKDFVIDMMETPWLTPLANGGFVSVVVYALLNGALLAGVWWLLCRFQLRWPFLWMLPLAVLFLVGQGPSWFGDLAVMLKVCLPWLLLCALIAAHGRWSQARAIPRS
jgi:hypothetical protein